MGGLTAWNFKDYIPHIVIISIGQNDSSTHGYVVNDEEFRNEWKDKYKGILTTLREEYTMAYFILTTSIMGHDTTWDDMIAEIQREVNDPKVKNYRYKRTGTGTPGHIRKSEAEEMASELAAFIETLDNPWQN